MSRSLTPSVCQRGRGARKSLWIFPFEGANFSRKGDEFWSAANGGLRDGGLRKSEDI